MVSTEWFVKGLLYHRRGLWATFLQVIPRLGLSELTYLVVSWAVQHSAKALPGVQEKFGALPE